MTTTKKTEAGEPKKAPVAKKPVAKKAPVAKKPTEKEVVVAKKPAKPVKEVGPKDWIYALGRRKTANAQVRFWPGKVGGIEVNGQPYDKFFKTYEQRAVILAALKAVGLTESAEIKATTCGGGPTGQAESVRLGISRALIKHNPELRLTLKKLGFLMRDPRAKERKKYGLKKARRAPQWAKR